MSYVRANGRFRGRICSGGGRACASFKARYSLGDDLIGEMAGGGQIEGDPIIALIAQLNRFAGKAITPGTSSQGTTCPTPRTYVRSAFPLVAQLTDQIATAANLILIDRYACAPIGTYSVTKHNWARQGLISGSVAFVQKNLTETVVTIAEFGDHMSLPPASVGITERAAKFTSDLFSSANIKPLAIAGGLLVAAFLVMRR